jgi:hypothetical protein
MSILLAVSRTDITMVVVGAIALVAILLAVSMTYVLWRSISARRAENKAALPDLLDIDPELRRDEALEDRMRESAFDVEEIKFDMDDLDEDSRGLLSEAYSHQSREAAAAQLKEKAIVTKGLFSRKKKDDQ